MAIQQRCQQWVKWVKGGDIEEEGKRLGPDSMGGKCYGGEMKWEGNGSGKNSRTTMSSSSAQREGECIKNVGLACSKEGRE